MKNNKPLALILFGLAVILCSIPYAIPETPLLLAGIIAAPVGLFLCFIGLIWALKQK